MAKKNAAEDLARTNAAEELDEIREEMLGLLQKALRVVKSSGDKMAVNRAEAYWYPHLAASLGHESYATRYDTTMVNTVRELRGEDEEDGE